MMEANSFTSDTVNDFRKKLEECTKSVSSKKKCFSLNDEDDEILDPKLLDLPSDPYTWLYVCDKCTPGQPSWFGKQSSESMAITEAISSGRASLLNQSRRSFDSRTYTRSKKRLSGLQQSPFGLQAAAAPVDDSTPSPYECNRSSYMRPFGPHSAAANLTDHNTMESSLGLIDIDNLTESQLGFRMAGSEKTLSSAQDPLNVTYEKNNSTTCIASEDCLNSTFILQSPPPNEPDPPSSVFQNTNFTKNPLSESTPLAQNLRLTQQKESSPPLKYNLQRNFVNHNKELNNEVFLNSSNKHSRSDDLMAISFPSMMMESISSPPSEHSMHNNLEGQASDTLIDNAETRKLSLGQGRCKESVVVNNLNAKYQESLIDQTKTMKLTGKLPPTGNVENCPKSLNISQITPPHSEFPLQPVHFSTPTTDVLSRRSSGVVNGCSNSSSTTDMDTPSPVSLGDSSSVVATHGTFKKSLNGTFNKSLDGTFNKSLDGTFNKSLDGTFNKSQDGTFNKSPHGTFNKSLDGTFIKSPDGTFIKSPDGTLNKTPHDDVMRTKICPLNSTFRKTPLSTTFCKSAEALNNGVGVVGVEGVGSGGAESGPDEDGMSTASDSSFSSSSTHMRSVGEIQSIARLQEESLSLQNNAALRKIAWGGSDSGDGDLTKGNQTAFRKQMSDDGNQSDHSDRSSERCSPTALNNNLKNVSRLSLKPLTSYRTGLTMQHARSVEQLPSGISLAQTKATFGLKRPTVVNKPTLTEPQPVQMTAPAQPPASKQPPPPKPSGLRPPTAIPRFVSRLPAPKLKTGLPRHGNGKASGQS